MTMTIQEEPKIIPEISNGIQSQKFQIVKWISWRKVNESAAILNGLIALTNPNPISGISACFKLKYEQNIAGIHKIEYTTFVKRGTSANIFGTQSRITSAGAINAT